MPAKSAAQKRLMDAAAHNPAFAKKVGIPTKVAKDFSEASKGRKFGTGGDVNYTYGGKGQINKQRTRGGSIFGVEKNVPNVNLNKYIGKKEGGMATEKMHSEKGEMKKDIAQDKKLIKKAFGMHDKQSHEGKKTNLSKLKGGGMAKAKETMGPRTMSKDVEKGSNKLTKFGESAVQKRGKTKGTNLGDSGPTRGIMGGMKKGGKVKKMCSGGMGKKK